MAGFHFGKKALKSKKVAAAVQKKAAAAQEYWKSIAPVFGQTGHAEHRAAPASGAIGAYRDSITVTDISGDDGPRARIQAHDWKSKWIEFGKPPHMPTYACKSKVLAKFRK